MQSATKVWDGEARAAAVRPSFVFGLGLCVLALGFSPTRSSAIEIGEDAELAIDVAVVSDYVFRGVSQTGEDPAVQLGLELALDEIPVSFGIWASQVDFGHANPIDYEVDFWAQVSVPVLDDFDVDFSVIQYYYPGSTGDENYTEWLIGTAVGDVYVEMLYTDDYFGNGRFYRLGAEYVYSHRLFDVGVHYGWNHIARPYDPIGDTIYLDWGVSVSVEWSDLQLGIEYTDVNRCRGEGTSRAGKELCDPRVLGSVSYSF